MLHSLQEKGLLPQKCRPASSSGQLLSYVWQSLPCEHKCHRLCKRLYHRVIHHLLYSASQNGLFFTLAASVKKKFHLLGPGKDKMTLVIENTHCGTIWNKHKNELSETSFYPKQASRGSHEHNICRPSLSRNPDSHILCT
mgnify:CR=1 FL=1